MEDFVITENNLEEVKKIFNKYNGKIDIDKGIYNLYQIVKQPEGLGKYVKFGIPWRTSYLELAVVGGMFEFETVNEFVSEWNLAKKIVDELLQIKVKE